jgi:putative transposase
MARKPRVEAPGAIQHVIARGNAGARIMRDDDDRRALLAALARVSEKQGWRVHAYCLMDTHMHCVVETPEPNLGTGMQRLLGGYAYEFNRRHGRYGHLFGAPYWSSLVETEAYAIQLCAYVVLNPVGQESQETRLTGRGAATERRLDWSGLLGSSRPGCSRGC